MAEKKESTLTSGGEEMRALASAMKDAVRPGMPTVRQRQGPGGRMLDYIGWNHAADVLDEFAGDWMYEVKSVQFIGSKTAIVHVSITINGVTRDGIGSEELDKAGMAPGDCVKSAEHDALKRAAVKFGVGRLLYGADVDFDADGNVVGGSPTGASGGNGGGGGGLTIKFGKAAGKTIPELTDADLEWYGKAAKQSLDDPEKAKFRDNNQRMYDALRDELKKRRAA